MTKDQCYFCGTNRFVLNKKLKLPAGESIVWEDENVFVTPDLFPLCVGHFLAITKDHYASFGNTPKKVYNSSRNAIDYLKKSILNGREVIVFEHGAVKEHTGGASIDHAHIHIMPLKYDIRPFIQKSTYTEVAQQELYSIIHELANKNQPYIYYQRSSGNAFVYPVDDLPSQFLRILVAKALGVSYDWKAMGDSLTKSRFIDTLKLTKGVLNETAI